VAFIVYSLSQPKVGEFWAKKKIWEWDLGLKSRSEKGVIVYGNFINITLTTFIFAFLYGRLAKVISLSPPHRATGSAHPIQSTNAK
jgi:hypothetical protein